MGTYLENYLESVSSLPQEVRRNFALLRELDSRSQELTEKVEKNTKAYIKNVKRQREVNPEEEQSIKGDLKQCLELGDEKVQLAVQTYELVDKHIRRLDTDLRKFEAELEQGNFANLLSYKTQASHEPASPYHAPSTSVQTSTPKHAETPNGKAGRKKAKLGTDTKAPNNNNNNNVPDNDARVLNVDIDMPIDPNEPTYCICGRVSFGEMVGCDSQDCKIEWFHFECVGLTHPPKGKWYCPDCTAIRKKQMYK